MLGRGKLEEKDRNIERKNWLDLTTQKSLDVPVIVFTFPRVQIK
jgi:hypothetical protein